MKKYKKCPVADYGGTQEEYLGSDTMRGMYVGEEGYGKESIAEHHQELINGLYSSRGKGKNDQDYDD